MNPTHGSVPLISEEQTDSPDQAASAAQQSPVKATEKPVANTLSPGDISRIIEMAWADEIPFDSILSEYGLNESAVIALMRREMKASSFRMWRKRVTGRASKHRCLSRPEATGN